MSLFVFLCLFALPAWAGVVLLPADPVVGDGQQTVLLHLGVPGVQPTDKVRVKPDAGEVVATRVPGPGLVAVELRPPAVRDPTTIQLEVRVRGGVTEDAVLPLEVSPAGGGRLELRPASAAVPYGATPVVLTVVPQGTFALPAANRRVRVTASVGTVEPPKAQPDGTWTTRWIPPKSGDPAIVLFSAVDLTEPGSATGAAIVALTVKRKLVLPADPGSENTLVVGSDTYGPATAGSDAKVSFDLVQDPSKGPGILQSTLSGHREDALVDAAPGAVPVAAFAPVHDKVPASASVRLQVQARRPDGTTWDDALVTLEGAGPMTAVGGGWFAADVTTPATPGTWEPVAVVVGTPGTPLANARVVVKARATVQHGLPRIALAPSPTVLPEAGGSLQVTATVRSATGVRNGLRLATSAAGAKVTSAPAAKGSGAYAMKATATGAVAEVTVWTATPATGLPLRRLVAWSPEPWVPADGTTTTRLVVASVDALGAPVPNVTLALAVPVGDLLAPATARTDASGVAVLELKAGVSPGPAVVRIDAGGATTHVVVTQAVTLEDARVVEAGTAVYRDLVTAWRAAVPTVRVARQAPVVAVAPGTVAPGTVAPGTVAPGPPAAGGGVSGGSTTASAAGTRALGGSSPGNDDASLLRVRVGVADALTSYSLESSGVADVPASFEYLQPGPWGVGALSASGEVWPNRWRVGLDARLRLRPSEVQGDVAGAEMPVPDHVSTWWASLAWRQPVGPLHAVATLGAQGIHTLVFRYADDAGTQLTPLGWDLWAARLGVGLRYELPALAVRVEVAESFWKGVFPVDTHVEALVDVRVYEQLTAWVGVERDRRTFEFVAGEETVEVLDRSTAILLGLGASL